jgi:hypothetical protein
MNKELKPAITIANESLDFATVFSEIDDYDFDVITSDDARKIIDSLLKNSNVNYYTKFIKHGDGMSKDFQDSSDSFVVTFEESDGRGSLKSYMSIHFYMGIGNRKKSIVELIEKMTEELTDAGFEIANTQTVTRNKRVLTSIDKANKEFTETFCEFVIMPRAADVLYSLVLDIECADMTFDEFCDGFGYNNDSIKDRDTFFRIKENCVKMKNVFGKVEIEVLKKVLSNY